MYFSFNISWYMVFLEARLVDFRVITNILEDFYIELWSNQLAIRVKHYEYLCWMKGVVFHIFLFAFQLFWVLIDAIGGFQTDNRTFTDIIDLYYVIFWYV